MKDFNDILNNDFLNSGISDELLAAYIDGNTTGSENALIENTLNGDSMLSEAYEIASDSVSFGSNFDWELHKGDFGFWELGLPPAITETDLSIATDQPADEITSFNEGIDIGLDLDTYNPLDDTHTSLDNTLSDSVLDTDNINEWNGMDDTDDSFIY